ncbi:T9SS type A sorting domain-containing protein [candidate division WOR-3 bacterium]|nr:T9SS type A sorting domain-containing protein [candidate division WOR-3 bacterium]
MKRITIVLISAFLLLPAAEWNVEQVTDNPDYFCVDPILKLDGAGRAMIVYTEFGEESHLKAAVNDTDSWRIRDVAEVVGPVYSFAINNLGSIVVAYSDWVGEEAVDLFLASDSTGEFVVTNITDDPALQFAPVLKLNQLGVPLLIYIAGDTPEDITELRYGWITAEGFESELVADNLSQDEILGYDLVLKRGSIQMPHVFYIGDDDYLWHAEPVEMVWDREPLNELSSEWPSAVADPLGSFHVAYDVGGSSIHYITDMSGAWQDEIVFDQLVPEGGNEHPSLDLETVYGAYLGIGNPHVVWIHADADWRYDLWYAGKPQGAWNQSVITETSEIDELPGYEPYFALDVQGYGHLTFAREDEGFVPQIFYAKSAEPLIGTGVTEVPTEAAPLQLIVKGSEVSFNLPVSEQVALNLYDASGRRIERLVSGYYSAGERTVPINSVDLSRGVYFVRGQIGGHVASAKFVVTR